VVSDRLGGHHCSSNLDIGNSALANRCRQHDRHEIALDLGWLPSEAAFPPSLPT
jgi:hypothetical protein